MRERSSTKNMRDPVKMWEKVLRSDDATIETLARGQRFTCGIKPALLMPQEYLNIFASHCILVVFDSQAACSNFTVK